MRQLSRYVFLIPVVIFSGCSSFQAPKLATVNPSSDYQKINDSQKLNEYLAKQNQEPQQQLRTAEIQPIRITIAEAIDKYVPRDFQMFVDPDVNVKTVITFNPAQPWADAFGKSLFDVNVEASANLYKRTMALHAFKASIGEIIDRYVPNSYRVYTDPEISLSTQLKWEATSYWIDALSKAGSEAGIDVSANLTSKTIFLKPMIKTNKQN